MLYRGDAIDAETAESWGLVEKITPQATLDEAVYESAQTLAANGPAGMRLQKALMRDWECLPLDQAIEAGIDSLASAYEQGQPGKYIRNAINSRKNT